MKFENVSVVRDYFHKIEMSTQNSLLFEITCFTDPAQSRDDRRSLKT